MSATWRAWPTARSWSSPTRSAPAARISRASCTPRASRSFTVDVSRRPELARKYGIAVVPVAVRVTRDGRVTERIAG